MLQPVVISYLVLDLSDAGIGAMLRPVPGFALRRCASVQPELNRFLYTAVGGDWHWTDRLGWSYTQWDAVLSSPGYETWILFEEGSIAGYFELEARPSQVVELAYFGLLPFYVGRGLGAPLLEHAIARAKEKRAARMTVNTCTLDHARALANYLARGFVLVETRTVQKDVPEVPPGPWPGARSAAV